MWFGERRSHLGPSLLYRASLNQVLERADIVTIHVPLTEATRNLISRQAIARMKAEAILVNTARGGIVDETTLAEALGAGRLLAAGLDVFENEPPRSDNPLLRLPNVVLTPHISAGTRDAMRQKLPAIFANLGRFFDGEELHNRVRFP